MSGTEKNGTNIFGKILVTITTGLTILFTSIIFYSYVTSETPNIVNGKVIPKSYSNTILYFPVAGPLFAESLADYLEKNNLQVMGMAGKNTIWTKGYIIAVTPKYESSKPEEKNIYIYPDTVIIIPEGKKK